VVVPELVAEACGRLGISPARDAFASPANHLFPAYWTREDDAFAQPWDYATASPLWANPPFIRLEEVVAKARGTRGISHADRCPGMARPPIPMVDHAVRHVPQAVAAPPGPANLPTGGTDLMPAPRWRTWAFLMDSREGSQSRTPPPAQATLPPPMAPPGPAPPRGGNPGAQLTTAHRHTDTLPLGSRPGKVERKRDASSPQAHPGAPLPHGRPPGPTLPRWGLPPRRAYPSSSRGKRRNKVRMPQHRRDLPLHRRVPPHGTPRWHRRRPIWDRHTGTCREIHGMPRGPPQGPRWIPPQNRCTTTCG